MNLKKCSVKLICLYALISFEAFGSGSIEKILKNDNLKNSDIKSVKLIVNQSPKDSIKKFFKILKDDKYPDRSRWLSLLLIGKTMGKKSTSMMIKYLEHPHWILRSAALKSLQSLKVGYPKEKYRKLLTDKSYVIREQALEIISTLKLKDLENDVLKMLGDKSNYIKTKKGMVASEVIKKVLLTLSTLGMQESIPLLRKLRNSKAGKSIKPQIDEAINKISI